VAIQFQSKNKRMRVVIEPIHNIYGREGVQGTTQGKTIEFKDYRYLSALKPSAEDMLERITDAATRQNVEKLRELKALEAVGDDEQGGHNRQEVIAAVDRALGILTDGKEGKLGPGRPHRPRAHEARKAQTVPDVA
jgi:magnesium-transporting ATPase (P-type)